MVRDTDRDDEAAVPDWLTVQKLRSGAVSEQRLEALGVEPPADLDLETASREEIREWIADSDLPIDPDDHERFD